MKNFLIRGFLGFAWLSCILLSFTIILLPLTIPLMSFLWRKIKYYTSIRTYGANARLRKIFVREENINGNHTRETGMYLLESKKGYEIFNEEETKRNNDVAIFKSALIGTNDLENVILTNEEFEDLILKKGN